MKAIYTLYLSALITMPVMSASASDLVLTHFDGTYHAETSGNLVGISNILYQYDVLDHTFTITQTEHILDDTGNEYTMQTRPVATRKISLENLAIANDAGDWPEIATILYNQLNDKEISDSKSVYDVVNARRVNSTVADAAHGRLMAPQSTSALWAMPIYSMTAESGTGNFDSSAIGVMVGTDKKFNDYFKFGLGLYLDKTDAKLNDYDFSIQNQSVFAYGQAKYKKLYFNTALIYSDGEYSDMSQDFTVKSYSADLYAGYTFLNMISPEIGIKYTYIDSYDREYDAKYKTSVDASDYLTLNLGLRFHKNINKFNISTKIAGTYDVISNTGVRNINLPTYVGAVSPDDLGKLGLNGEIILGYNVNNWILSAGYDIQYQDFYINHTGFLKAEYKF